MKQVFIRIISLIIILLTFPVLMVSAESSSSPKADFRGLWVASVVNIDYPSKPTTDSEILKAEAIKVLDSAKATGFNAIFLQVRPSADALYKSNYFPWSKYLTGSQGLMPDNDFDPLKFWIEEAHKRGIELHAWINPYRITKITSGEPRYDFASLAANNPAIIHPDWVVKYTDGNLYFDPGIPEVQQLIIDSVLEIINNYAVDGIHFDDYFYPGTDFNDQITYQKYNTANQNINDWRRSNVNNLIGNLSTTIKNTGKNIRFGISPFGIWANKGTTPLGSDTKGTESLNDHYADTRKWVKDGLIDYIAPQIYWSIGNSVADYSKLVNWWKEVVSGTSVDLYIGQAAYRTGSEDSESPWYGISEIEKQLKLNASFPEIKGNIFFNYKALEDNPALNALIKGVYEQRDGITSNIPVNISIPSENIETYYTDYYLNGSSDPNKPLFLNGNPVENRSSQGYFGILVPLQKGENIFTLSQEGTYATRVIYRKTASTTPGKMSTIEIPSGTAFPESQEYRSSGEKITLSCQAPIGSKVSVKIGGKSYSMLPANQKNYGSGAYITSYSYVYTVPSYKGTPRNLDLGNPIYTMNYKGIVKTRKAPAKLGVIMKSSPFYAKVINEVVDTYETPSSTDGAAYELYSGMTDYITGMTGSYVRLSSGQWVRKTNVSIYTSKKQLNGTIKKAVYLTGDKWDTLELEMAEPGAAFADFDGNLLILNISAVQKATLPELPTASMFSVVSVSKLDNLTQYKLTLKENQKIEGYSVEKTSKGLLLRIKRPIKPVAGGAALSGITIMLDPGHGGSETGAIGPLGLNMAEKAINLQTALKLKSELEQLGARVLMTRTTDTTVSLTERLAASRKAKPDLFISIHANSMSENVDISKLSGLGVYYRENSAQAFAQNILESTLESTGRNNYGIHVKNFYVIRGTWTPSILIETGFVPNPDEFQWLTDENEQAGLAKSLSEAIVKYFTM